jgi:polyisoprenoid-binding protein YceI
VLAARLEISGSTVGCHNTAGLKRWTMASSTGTRTAPLIPTGTWTVDAAHSSVRFSVKQMGIANVRGKFSEFEGTLEMRENLADCRAFGTVNVTSIDTGEPQRDDHLRSADFFNVEEFPEMTFESTHAEAIDDESSRVVGNLTMHGITKEITLDVLVQGTDTDPWGNTRAGLEIVGKLLRSDFDMKFNQALGSGNKLVGDKVGLSLDISAVLQTPS